MGESDKKKEKSSTKKLSNSPTCVAASAFDARKRWKSPVLWPDGVAVTCEILFTPEHVCVVESKCA